MRESVDDSRPIAVQVMGGDNDGDKTSRVVKQAAQATVLVIAGLDPSGGAGLLADARHVQLHGFHCAGVATALTEQDSLMCAWMHPVAADVVSNQLARLVDDLEIHAVKVGMLANAEVAQVVATVLKRLCAGRARVPIVVDPVLRATRGVPLLEGAALKAYLPLLELTTLITPNLAELSALSGETVTDTDGMVDVARRLRTYMNGGAVLAKGGHLDGDPVDILVDVDGEARYGGKRVEGQAPHGTGCALSTDIACRLGMSTPLREAVRAGTERIRQLISSARTVGKGRPFL